jgi:hypothetical protein
VWGRMGVGVRSMSVERRSIVGPIAIVLAVVIVLDLWQVPSSAMLMPNPAQTARLPLQTEYVAL